jgi:competence protein ComEC
VAWLAADGADAAIVAHGEEIALKPGKRAYQTQLWAQRRGFALPADADLALGAHYDCDRQGCSPRPGVRPAIAAWWTIRKPKPERLEALCRNAEILILRADVPTPADCARARILRPMDFVRGGAAEVFTTPDGGYRYVWAQPLRGVRPWTQVSGSGG